MKAAHYKRHKIPEEEIMVYFLNFMYTLILNRNPYIKNYINTLHRTPNTYNSYFLFNLKFCLRSIHHENFFFSFYFNSVVFTS